MERERTGPASQTETPRGPSPSELAPLIAAARAAEGLDRFVAAGRINDLLIAMRRPGNETAEAKAILAALDVSTFDGLVDGNGRDCRKEAVETLLACGFPHALNVAPEDLDHARRTPAVRAVGARTAPPATSGLVRLAGGVALTAGAWQMWHATRFFRFEPRVALILLAAATMMLMASGTLLKLKAEESLVPSWGFLLAGVFGLAALPLMGEGTFSWPVAAACVSSGVLATLGRSREESDGT